MTRINTNTAALRGLRNLNRSNNLLNTSLTRLSTGLKINSGKDNPAGLIGSELLRTQITVIEQSLSNSSRANNVIATADAALGEINGLLNQIRGLVQEGLNTGALSQAEIEANQAQIDSALSAINRISANTKFGSDKLLDGSKAFNTSISTADAAKLGDVKINEALFGSSSSIAVNATVNTVAERAQLRYDGGDLTAAATIEVGGSKGTEVIFLGSSATTSDIRAAINAVSDSTGVTASSNNVANLTVAARAATVTIDQDSGATTDEDITFTRDTAGLDSDLGGSVSVAYIDPSANDAALSVSVTVDGSGNQTINVSLATDSGGAITSTAADVVAAVNGDATAGGLVTAAADGAGTGVLAAEAATALVGGRSAATLVVADDRLAGSNTLEIDVTDGGAGSTATVNSFDGTQIDITIDDSATLATIAAAINNFADLNNIASASVTGDGTNFGLDGEGADNLLNTAGPQVRLTSEDFGSAESVSVNVLAGTFATTDVLGTTTRSDTGLDIGVTINGQNAVTRGLRAEVRSSVLNAELTFNEANNTAAETATVNITGGGSVFQIGQDVSVSGQVGLGIDGVNTGRLGGVSGKLYELGTGAGKSLLDVGPNVTGASLVDIIDEALTEVNTLRGRLGSLQRNVIETNISSLGVALESIQDSRSSIIDTDFAEETANLTRAQILSQSGLSVLGIANQNPAQVLSLLG